MDHTDLEVGGGGLPGGGRGKKISDSQSNPPNLPYPFFPFCLPAFNTYPPISLLMSFFFFRKKVHSPC